MPESMARCEGVTLRSRVGGLIDTEIESSASAGGSPSSRRRRSPGEGEPVPKRRSLRVHATDDSLDRIRDAARASFVSFERYLGELVGGHNGEP